MRNFTHYSILLQVLLFPLLLEGARVPVIDVTDLYHPYQDPADNFDLLMAYGLPEIDLKAVVLDATPPFRRQLAYSEQRDFYDDKGPREPGIIPVAQLNYLFGRDVPFALGPTVRMRSPQDTFEDLNPRQQGGIDLIIETLRNSDEPVHIVSFGSARAIAAAYNRNPVLFSEKIARIHLSAGASGPGFREWNTGLDPNAIVSLLRSNLPVAIYPPATRKGAFQYGPHNTFWTLPNLAFVGAMDTRLGAYLAYAFNRSVRIDFLRAVERRPSPEEMERLSDRRLNLWETAVWMEVSGRTLVSREGSGSFIVAQEDLREGDRVITNELWNCELEVTEEGDYSWKKTEKPSHFSIYFRDDPIENERHLRLAVPHLLQSFSTGPIAKEPENTGLGGAVNLGQGWKWLDWFGTFNDKYYPWIRHDKIGWLYLEGNSESLYLKTKRLGWFWTRKDIFPLAYLFEKKTWRRVVVEPEETEKTP